MTSDKTAAEMAALERLATKDMLERLEAGGDGYLPKASGASTAEADELAASPHWTYLEALAWIGLRDHQAVVELLASRPGLAAASGPGSSYAWLNMKLCGLGVPNGQAWSNLRAACQQGAVIAEGVRAGESRRATVPTGDWTVFDWIDLPEAGQIDDYATNWRPGVSHWRVWEDLRFDRVSVVAAFPSEFGQAEPVYVEPWRYRPGDSQMSYATRPEVVEEAERLVPSQLGAPASEAAICREIAKLSAIDGPNWPAQSIAVQRRAFRRTLTARR
jgi:hypothetical protein